MERLDAIPTLGQHVEYASCVCVVFFCSSHKRGNRGREEPLGYLGPMAPKAKASTPSKQPRKVKAAVAISDAAAAVSESDAAAIATESVVEKQAFNATYLLELESALETITQHEGMVDILTAKPLKINIALMLALRTDFRHRSIKNCAQWP